MGITRIGALIQVIWADPRLDGAPLELLAANESLGWYIARIDDDHYVTAECQIEAMNEVDEALTCDGFKAEWFSQHRPNGEWFSSGADMWFCEDMNGNGWEVDLCSRSTMQAV
jgi:hypothetical protein